MLGLLMLGAFLNYRLWQAVFGELAILRVPVAQLDRATDF